MTEQEIVKMLDQLAEFQAMRTMAEINKRDLLDEVKVPAEVEKLQAEALEEARRADKLALAEMEKIRAEREALLNEIVVPEEIRAQIEAIYEKRRQIENEHNARIDAVRTESLKASARRADELSEKTREMFAAIEARKREIEAEFAGKTDDVDRNIADLEKRIKEAVKAHGATVKGEHYQAVYVRGRITWNTDKMEAWVVDHPFLRDARKEGEPSITLRKVS